MFKRILTLITIVCPLSLAAQHIAIGERTFKFNDSSRNRPVTTEVWYPTNDAYTAADSSYEYPFVHIPVIRNAHIPTSKHPLVIISHGTGGGRITLEWLADALVQKGFIVAAVDHWGNTYNNKIAIDFVTPWQRPLDISFAVTQLLGDKEFGSVIDQNRIGAAGFSIGGYTGIALAGGRLDFDALMNYMTAGDGRKTIAIPEFPDLMKSVKIDDVKESFRRSPDLMDKRIKAFFIICPAIGQGFERKSQLSRINKPFFIVGAQSDSIAPSKLNAEHYHHLIKGSGLVVIPGKVGHYAFLNEGVGEFKKHGGIYTNDDSSVDRHAVHKQVGDLAAKFFLKSM